MSTLQERLLEVFPEPHGRGLKAQIAGVCKVAPASVSNWFGNPEKVTTISRENAEKLVSYYGLHVSAAWLAEGKLPKMTQPDSQATAPPIASAESDTVPDGYVRLEHLSPRPAMGDGGLVDMVHVVRHLDVLEQWVRQKVGTTNPNRIKVLTGNGNSMEPTIQDQDLVFVDVGQQSIEVAGIYVIDVAGRLLLKKALILSDGTLILRSDNTEEYPDEERHNLAKTADTIHVAGRVLAWWTLRRG